MSSEHELAIAAELLVALENDQVDLPTLPDTAVKTRLLLDDPNVSADRLVNLLSADPVISTHIIKAANSAKYANFEAVDNLRDAITRIGYQMLHNLVMNITLTKLFRNYSPPISPAKAIWMAIMGFIPCCQEYQGYLYSRPLPLPELEIFLKRT